MTFVYLTFNPGKERLTVVENLFCHLTVEGKRQPAYFVA